MVTEHRHHRGADGVSSFAIVSVSSTPHDSWGIVWNSAASEFEKIYGSAIEAGIKLAASEHERRGGQPQLVEIISLVERLVDTRDDAVTCAVCLASWKNWGHAEDDAKVIYEEGQWRVIFVATQ